MVYETVTDIDQLLDRVRSYQPEADLSLVRKAYDFSAKAHEGQTRRSGEPYVQHPVAVAGVLTLLKTDVAAVVAGLLHDTLEDTVATPAELEREFGKEVVHLVDGVTKIGKITRISARWCCRWRTISASSSSSWPIASIICGLWNI